MNNLITMVMYDRIYEGAPYNLPDERSLQAGRDALQLAMAASDGDLIITLVSGGGSALLPLPLNGISLEDKTKVCACDKG